MVMNDDDDDDADLSTYCNIHSLILLPKGSLLEQVKKESLDGIG